MSSRASLVVALVVVVSAVGPARADVVRLKNGGQIRGRVVEESETQVVVETDGGRVTLERRKVASISREAEPAPEKKPAAVPAPGGLPRARAAMTTAEVEALT